ncbi:terminase large subunit [Pedobacter sp.]|uniref:terminase large subunit n=1 Tax=Pedobacter sp. TaxID=1411316 RepID=UPI003C36DD8A
MSNSEQLQAVKVEMTKRELARRSFFDFVPYVFPQYQMQWFHKVICEKLEKVRTREIKKLMIFMPPQHGKSQLATRLFPAYALGKNPNEKIAIASYSARLSMSFSRSSQRSMSDKLYKNIFPDIRLPDRGEGAKTAEFFEIIGGTGSLMSVGVEGSLTGSPVDIGIIDDPVKDRQDAQSITIRESTWAWYVDVFSTRLHNNSVQLIIQTRWHEDDLSGRILEQDGIYSESNPNGWQVVKFTGLRTKDQNDYDPREEGEALWPERHSRERLENVKAKNLLTFDSLYQQDPKPSKESLVFPDWEEIDEMPECDVDFFGLDFGFTNDPTALIHVGKIGNNLYLDEWIYENGLTNTDIRLRSKAMNIGRREIYAESAEPKSIEELKNPKDENGRVIRDAGLNAIPAVKGKDSVNAGISLLKEYKVHYTKRSLNIKKEKNNYCWIMQGGVNTNIPVDAYNHACDAIRMAVYTKYAKVRRTWSVGV